MSEIVFVQNIFGPNQGQTTLNVNSILSLVDYLKDEENASPSIDILYAGWCSDEKYWAQIIDAANTIPESCPVYLKKLDKNYGKAFSINFMLKDYLANHPETKYILTIDSDICFVKDQKFLLQRAAVACQISEQMRKQKTGFIALNQADAQCHWLHMFDQSFEYDISLQSGTIPEKISWPSNKSGIAGGCIFISREAWDSVGGYSFFGHNHPYGPDDGHLLRIIQEKGFTASVLTTLSMRHPEQNDEEYILWKKNVMKDAWENFSEEKFAKNIDSADDFWRSRPIN